MISVFVCVFSTRRSDRKEKTTSSIVTVKSNRPCARLNVKTILASSFFCSRRASLHVVNGHFFLLFLKKKPPKKLAGIASTATVVDIWRTPVRIMILFGFYHLVKRAIYLSSKKLFNNGGDRKKPKKRKNCKTTTAVTEGTPQIVL